MVCPDTGASKYTEPMLFNTCASFLAESGTPLVQSIQIEPDFGGCWEISASISALVGKHEIMISACTACSIETACVANCAACACAFDSVLFQTHTSIPSFGKCDAICQPMAPKPINETL